MLLALLDWFHRLRSPLLRADSVSNPSPVEHHQVGTAVRKQLSILAWQDPLDGEMQFASPLVARSLASVEDLGAPFNIENT